MTDICRLCASLKTLEQLQAIGDPTLSLKTKLARCCQFEFPAEDDFLPQSVCGDCILCLNNNWTFSERVLQAQETLKRAFIIDYDTNETFLKNEIFALEQQHQQIEYVENNHQFNRRKMKQPIRCAIDGNHSEICEKKMAEKKIHDLSLKIRSMIISLHTKGYSNHQISSKLNIPETSVSEWLYTHNQSPHHTIMHSFNDESVNLASSAATTTTAMATNFKIEVSGNETAIEINNNADDEIENEAKTISGFERVDNQQPASSRQIENNSQHSVTQIVLKTDTNIYEIPNQRDYHTNPSPPVDHTISRESVQEKTAFDHSVNGSDNENGILTDDDDEGDEENEEEEDEEEEDADDDDVDDDDDDDDDNDDEIVVVNENVIDYTSAKSIDTNYDGTNILGLNEMDKNADGTIAECGQRKINYSSWNDYPWKCYQCGIIIDNLVHLREHYVVTHQYESMRYVCVDCTKTFSKFISFVLHVQRIHRLYLKFCCDICFKYFWNTNALRTHRIQHNCNIDERVDSENGIVDNNDNSNSKTNLKERSFLCQTCGKGFRSSSTLQMHARCHLPTDIKNTYKCDICFRKFGTKPNLTAHKRIHAGVRDFTCDQCGKSFVQKGNLDNHLLTHISNKPHICDICCKSFKTPLRLIKHKTVHTGLKPHKCDVCGREFREKGTLREHVRIHTGAMPFTCEYCGKRFRFKGVLTTHRRQHTGERPYSCVECNHHFTNWPNYNKHMKRRHGINTSVTVRKPQTIPPSGMPEKAKLNHIIPTAHNLGLIQSSISSNTINHIENNDTSCVNEKHLLNVDKANRKLVMCEQQLTSIQQQHQQHHDGTIQHHSEISSENATDNNCQPTHQITVLAHPAARSLQQVLNSQNHNIHPTATTQYSYIPTSTAMLGFYNIQGADIDLMQSTNIHR